MPIKHLTIESDTASEAYDRILQRCEGGPIANFLCEFPASGLDDRLAERYRFRGDGESAADVVREIVSWWQHPTVPGGLARSFNHGSRLRGKDADWNQIPKIVRELHRNPDTTKAHATLQSHRPGFAETHGHPSLCDAFFGLRVEGSTTFLDVTATFRKLELRHWWIVNVHELAFLQRLVVEALDSGDRPIRATAGTIATFAFRAVFVDVDEEPEVAVHALDRALLFRPEILRELATKLATRPYQGELFQRWRQMVKDLVPTARMNPDGFPICLDGLAAIGSNVALLADATKVPLLQELAETLESIRLENVRMVEAINLNGLGGATEALYRGWRERCAALVARAEKQIADHIGMPGLVR